MRIVSQASAGSPQGNGFIERLGLLRFAEGKASKRLQHRDNVCLGARQLGG